MKKAVRIALLLMFFGLAAALPAWGQKEKDTPIQVSGRVRLVGNDPFPELVITGSDGEWYIESGEEYKLKNLQQQTVTVEGIETVITLKFANGFPAGKRRILKDIKIISVN